MKSYKVYVIKSIEGLRYTGMTEDLEKRLLQHNNKELSFWTKRGSMWRVIFKKEFENKSNALTFEKWLKSGVGREFLKNNCTDY